MAYSPLLRFFDAKDGPIIGLDSASYPSFWRRTFWYSVAHLHPKWKDICRGDNVFGFVGGGWSRHKEESQRKAIIEAIERWSMRYFATTTPEFAGLHFDPTSNGFAALPVEMGHVPLLRHAYHEALERWALNRIWDRGDLIFRRCEPPADTASLFASWKGRLHCFAATLLGKSMMSLPPEEIAFVLCVFENECRGAIPGSACGPAFDAALTRATMEAYVHCVAVDKMKKGRIAGSITERRLNFFANNPQGFDMVFERLKLADASHVHMTPEICFAQHLAGPWNPEVNVFRAIVEDSMPICSGGLDRFLI